MASNAGRNSGHGSPIGSWKEKLSTRDVSSGPDKVIPLVYGLTWYVVLASVSAAKARDSTGDNDHKNDGNATNDEKKFQVNLAVSSSKPSPTFTSNL